MATYEYECQHCGHRFEASQKMSEEPLSACPKCKQKVKRLISTGTSLIFKGAGFYATDYKKKSALPAEGCPKAHDGCGSCPHK